MQEIGDQTGEEAPRLCHYFDLIGGTSTGGLIAIMLRRLGTVHQSVKRSLTWSPYKSASPCVCSFPRKYSKLTKSWLAQYALTMIPVTLISWILQSSASSRTKSALRTSICRQCQKDQLSNIHRRKNGAKLNKPTYSVSLVPNTGIPVQQMRFVAGSSSYQCCTHIFQTYADRHNSRDQLRICRWRHRLQ